MYQYQTFELTFYGNEPDDSQSVIDLKAVFSCQGLLYFQGHLSGFEMVNRLWHCFVMGGYGTHGETFMHPEDILWWGKGGKLYGESVARIGFLKEIVNDYQNNN